MAYIIISAPDGSAHEFQLASQLGAELLIGSDPGCGISYPAESGLAAVHAKICTIPRSFILVDAQGNGLTADGQPTRETALKEGVNYGMGRLQLRFVNAEMPQSAPAAVVAPAQPEKQQLKAKGLKTGVSKRSSLRNGVAASAASHAAAVLPKTDWAEHPMLIAAVVLLGFYGGLVLRQWQDSGVFNLSIF